MSNLITLPQIQESLGIKITGDFISDVLGIEPTDTEKRAKFYTEAQYNEIRSALVNHIDNAEEIARAPAKKAPAAAKKAAKAPVVAKQPTLPLDDGDDDDL